MKEKCFNSGHFLKNYIKPYTKQEDAQYDKVLRLVFPKLYIPSYTEGKLTGEVFVF